MHVATWEEIKSGRTTDIYFQRTKKILEEKKISKNVVAEFTIQSIDWGVFVGLEEVLELLEGIDVNLFAMPEGSIFYEGEPVLQVEGDYKKFCELETPILGFICQASGVATKAAKLRKITEKPMISFGIRRMHPTIAPMIDRAAYIGGMDGFSGVAAEKLIGKKASGTMPHALVLILQDRKLAFKYFDEVAPKDVPRIALIDTLCDEKFEALDAAEVIENLYAVRLDTPSSRRGDFNKIIEEVRWELDIRGYENVKIFVSGGIDEEDLKTLKADAFGVGTCVSNAKTIDFAMDIVEVEGKPYTKRGKFSGRKRVFHCMNCGNHKITYKKEIKNCECGGEMREMLKKYIENGGIVERVPKVEDVRNYVLEQLKNIKI